MEDIFIRLDLSDPIKEDLKGRKNDIINARKKTNSLIRESREKSKLSKCYYCGVQCDGFCNSHTLPAFCLRNIARRGDVFYSNSILKLPSLNDYKGIKDSGTFHLICRDCDSKIFQEYENPDSYKNIPTTKMLAQISMKNNLKNISKRLIEKEMYGLMSNDLIVGDQWKNIKNKVSDLDLKEYEDSFCRAKNTDIKPSSGNYNIGFYEKLPYVVPMAFQGTVALIFDLEGNVINYIYNHSPKYKIENVNICIFPLKESSVIMLFVDEENKRYRQFFHQLKKLDLKDQLSVINYIIFSYSEEYFLSPTLDKDVLDKLKVLSGKTPEMISLHQTKVSQRVREIKKKMKEIKNEFDYSERNSVPILLSDEFALKYEEI